MKRHHLVVCIVPLLHMASMNCYAMSDAEIASELSDAKARIQTVIPAQPVKRYSGWGDGLEPLAEIEPDLVDALVEYIELHGSLEGLDGFVEGFFIPLEIPKNATNSKALEKVDGVIRKALAPKDNKVTVKFKRLSLEDDRQVFALQLTYRIPLDVPHYSPIYIMDISARGISRYVAPKLPTRRRCWGYHILGFIESSTDGLPKVVLLEHESGRIGRFDLLVWSLDEDKQEFTTEKSVSGLGYVKCEYDEENAIFTYWLMDGRTDEETRYSVDLHRLLSGEEQPPTYAE